MDSQRIPTMSIESIALNNTFLCSIKNPIFLGCSKSNANNWPIQDILLKKVTMIVTFYLPCQIFLSLFFWKKYVILLLHDFLQVIF